MFIIFKIGLYFIYYCDKCYVWKDLQITWSLQRKPNKNKIKLTESLKGNKVEKNYTRNNIK